MPLQPHQPNSLARHSNARARFAKSIATLALWLLSAVLLPVPTSRAELIVAYASQGSSGALAASEVASGVTAIDLHRGSGITDAGGSTFNSRGWNGSSLAEAVDLDDRLEWGWDAGPAWDLEWLTLLYDRSPTGPTRLSILLSVDQGLNWQTIYDDESVSANSDDQPMISLSDFQNVESARFRLHGWGSASSAGTFDIENFTSAPSRGISVTGSLANPAAVPEPALTPFLAVSAAAGWFLKRRRRAAGDTYHGDTEKAEV